MLEYDRRDISEGIDINKINASKECDICQYLIFAKLYSIKRLIAELYILMNT